MLAGGGARLGYLQVGGLRAVVSGRDFASIFVFASMLVAFLPGMRSTGDQDR